MFTSLSQGHGVLPVCPLSFSPEERMRWAYWSSSTPEHYGHNRNCESRWGARSRHSDQQITCGYTSFDVQMSQPQFNKNSYCKVRVLHHGSFVQPCDPKARGQLQDWLNITVPFRQHGSRVIVCYRKTALCVPPDYPLTDTVLFIKRKSCY